MKQLTNKFMLGGVYLCIPAIGARLIWESWIRASEQAISTTIAYGLWILGVYVLLGGFLLFLLNLRRK